MKNWLKNPAFLPAISRKSKIMETCQALKSWDSSYEPYIFPPIRFSIQMPRQTILTTNVCWSICHNVRKNKLQRYLLLWKPIFGRTNIPKNRISPTSEFFREYFWIFLNHAKKVARLLPCQPPLCLSAEFFKKLLYPHTLFYNANSVKNLYAIHKSLIICPLFLLVMGMIHRIHIVLQKLPVLFRQLGKICFKCLLPLFQFPAGCFCFLRLDGILPVLRFAAQLLKDIRQCFKNFIHACFHLSLLKILLYFTGSIINPQFRNNKIIP